MKKEWQTITLGDACEDLFAGGDVPKDLHSKSASEKYDVPIFTNGETNMGLYGYTNKARVTKPSLTISARGTIGYSEIRYEPFYPAVRLIVATPKEDVLDIKYLKYVVNDFDFVHSGTSIPQLTVPMVRNHPISVPPLIEQKRIVKILDEKFEAIESLKKITQEQLLYAKELFESKLKKVFEDPTFSQIYLADVCKVERGSSPRPIVNYITDDDQGINWIKIGDTKNINRYLYKTRQKITREGAEQSRYVNENDLILSNSMSFGKPYIMKTSGCIHDGWFVLRPNKDLDTEFFYYSISSRNVQDQMSKLATGAVVKNISGDLVKKVLLSLPDLKEQKQVVKELDELSRKTKELGTIFTRKIAYLEDLKKAYLNDAFSGKL